MTSHCPFSSLCSSSTRLFSKAKGACLSYVPLRGTDQDTPVPGSMVVVYYVLLLRVPRTVQQLHKQEWSPTQAHLSYLKASCGWIDQHTWSLSSSSFLVEAFFLFLFLFVVWWGPIRSMHPMHGVVTSANFQVNVNISCK